MNKVSIVTGGAQGLGRAIALELARKGSHLVVGDVNLETAQRVTEEVHALGRRSLALRVDVSNARDVSEMADRVVKEFGRIDILINNAGICQVVTIEKMSEEDWDRVMAINLKGVFLCSKAVMGVMRETAVRKDRQHGFLGRKSGRHCDGCQLFRLKGRGDVFYKGPGQGTGALWGNGERSGAGSDRDRHDTGNHSGRLHKLPQDDPPWNDWLGRRRQPCRGFLGFRRGPVHYGRNP